MANAGIVTIAVVPDSQFYAERSPETFEAQMDWIVANRERENIVYVAHLGDLKDDAACDSRLITAGTGNNRTEWQIVSDALSKLEGNNPSNAVIPYGVLPGNHDFDSITVNNRPNCPNWSTQRPLAGFNDPNIGFPPSRFNGRPWYGDPGAGRRGNRVDNSNEDNFILFESNGLKFIAINLAYRPAANPSDNNPATDDAPELTWADALLKAYPDRVGFITSHYFMEQNPEVGGNPSPCVPGACARDCPKPTGLNQIGTYGQEVYDALSDNPNLLMMLSAHWFGEAWRVQDRSGAGLQPVQVLLQDYQATLFPDDGNPNTPPNDPDPTLIDFGNLNGSKCNFGDSGFMRLYRFDTNTLTVNVETFIPPVVPIKNRTDTLVSTYVATDGSQMDKDTASNLRFSFADYANTEPTFDLTGSRANDIFVRFLSGIIPADAMNRRCADGDGCRITLTRTYGTAAPTVFGPCNFTNNPAANQFQLLASDCTVTGNGNNGDGTAELILGSQADTNCWLSDWDTSTAFGLPDQNANFSVLILNSTPTNLTCTITIED